VVASYETCVVFMLGYPGMGKRTVGGALAQELDGVLVDNALLHRPLLELFRWDGKQAIPMEIWDRVAPIREAVLGTIRDLAPPSNNYVFTNCLPEGGESAAHYASIRSLAHERSSLFLSVMLDCDIDVQVSRIDNPDRVALRKGSDPEGYRWHRLNTSLFQPPAGEVLQIDTTSASPDANAAKILAELEARGFRATPSE
jgi:shikimate kinase